jgi:PAS domain S-box-containing protein
MDNGPDLIYFNDTTGRFTTINRALARALNISGPEDALGETDFKCFAEVYAQPTFADEQEILRIGRPPIGKADEIRLHDKSSVWVSTTKMVVRDLESKVIGTFGVSRDITEAKRAEQELRQAKEKLEDRVQSVPLN